MILKYIRQNHEFSPRYPCFNLGPGKQSHRFSLLQIDFNHALLAGNLPDIHKDPFDRMLIAQAIIEKLTLITRDKLIGEYDVQTLMA